MAYTYMNINLFLLKLQRKRFYKSCINITSLYKYIITLFLFLKYKTNLKFIIGLFTWCIWLIIKIIDKIVNEVWIYL